MDTPDLKLENSLILEQEDIAVDLSKKFTDAPLTYRKKTGDRKREIRKLTKKETARQAIAGMTPETDIFGLTRGQFSLIELLDAVLDYTGPAKVFLSTWTAASADLADVVRFLKSGKISSARFLLDFSFQRRQPEVAQAIREQFGYDAVRVTRNHAKFFLVENDTWALTCKTSMNLNTNPRFEDFDITNDPALFSFMKGITDEIFEKHNARTQARGTASDHWQEWRKLAL